MSIGMFDASMMRGLSEVEVKNIRESNLIPKGSYDMVVDGVTLVPDPREFGGTTFHDDELLHMTVSMHVQDGQPQGNRKISEHYRFWNFAKPGLVDGLPNNLQNTHYIALRNIIALVEGSEVQMDRDDSGQGNYIQTAVNSLRGAVVNAYIGIRNRADTGEGQNTIGNFKRVTR